MARMRVWPEWLVSGKEKSSILFEELVMILAKNSRSSPSSASEFQDENIGLLRKKSKASSLHNHSRIITHLRQTLERERVQTVERERDQLPTSNSIGPVV